MARRSPRQRSPPFVSVAVTQPLLPVNRLTLCRNHACRFCDIIHRIFLIRSRIVGFCDVGLDVVGLSPGCLRLQLKKPRKWDPRELTIQFSVRLSPLGNCRHCCPWLFCSSGVRYSWVPPRAPCTAQSEPSLFTAWLDRFCLAHDYRRRRCTAITDDGTNTRSSTSIFVTK